MGANHTDVGAGMPPEAERPTTPLAEGRAGSLARAKAWADGNRHVVCVGVMVLLAGILSLGVDLRPKVGPEFFFGSDDPSMQDTQRIKELFPSGGTQLIFSAAAPDIFAEAYLTRVRTLSERLIEIDGVQKVMSVSHGPGSVQRAEKSPLWSRLLIARTRTSTLVVAMVDATDMGAVVREAEAVVAELGTDTFRLRISGMPYIVEMIRRNILSDLKTFTAAAVVVFGTIIMVVFRSTKILAGTLVACICAVMLTLIGQAMLGGGIGPLTANLATIVFVLTQSHIIFLTANWQRLRRDAAPGDDPESLAVHRTFTASFWCMITTLLGFLSLLFVAAQPLRELGLGGSVGTFMAIACAFLVYPPFLRWARQGDPVPEAFASPPTEQPGHLPGFLAPRLLPRRAGQAAAVILLIGVTRLDTDPSLLTYFASGSELREGLEFIDANGGSSPLQVVISMPDGSRLDNDAGYLRLWELQGALSANPSVGTSVSLPVLMAEVGRHRAATLLPWSRLLDVMNWDRFGNVASNFVTPDRTRAMFVLRMMESGREQERAEVIADLTELVESLGLEVHLLGGIYALQGQLAHLVKSSLITGLGALLLLFAGVAYIVSRSATVSLAMVAGVATIPLVLFGCIGLFGVPVDVISAPAGNVCIGIGVDAMIHLALAVRLRARGATARPEDWAAALQEQGRPTLIAAGVVVAGFAIFALSGFPPTQRFGLAIVLGAGVAAFATLRVFPLLGGVHGSSALLTPASPQATPVHVAAASSEPPPSHESA